MCQLTREFAALVSHHQPPTHTAMKSCEMLICHRSKHMLQADLDKHRCTVQTAPQSSFLVQDNQNQNKETDEQFSVQDCGCHQTLSVIFRPCCYVPFLFLLIFILHSCSSTTLPTAEPHAGTVTLLMDSTTTNAYILHCKTRWSPCPTRTTKRSTNHIPVAVVRLKAKQCHRINKTSNNKRHRTISTGVAAAFVMSLLTVGAHEPGWTAAAVTTGRVFHAGSTIKTRVVRTRHSTDLAVLPIEALRTHAQIVVHQILEKKRGEKVNVSWSHKNFAVVCKFDLLTHFAAAAVLAGVAVTLVGLNLAVFAREAGSAGAGVAALPSVGAGGIVLTWLVVGAVVKVCSSETEWQTG